MNEIKKIYRSLDKFYLANFALAGFLMLNIFLMFLVQFKVESLQDKMVRVKTEISTYEDEIQLLEVEWVYLTRPQRLRTLASRYLENNSYTLANQIKNSSQLEEYYFASYKKLEEQPISLAENQNKSKQISF